MAEQVGKFLTELPELTSPSDSNLMYVVDGDTSKKATLGNLKKIVGGDVTGAGSGAVVSFSDGADDAPLESLSVAINPVQDLHGYDKPWAGGAGKNKLPNTPNDIGTFSGVTVALDEKGRFILNGTATENNSIRVGTATLPSGNYTFDGMTETGSSSTFFMNISPTFSGTGNYNLYEGEYTGSTNETLTFGVRIYFRQGATFNNTIFEPMIRESTASSGYEPYSNICPISGHTSITVTDEGKNKLPLTATSDTVNGVTFTVNSDGTVSTSGTASAQANFNLSIFNAYGGNYVLSGCPSGGGGSTYNLRIDDSSSGTNQCVDDGSGTSQNVMTTAAGTSVRARIRIYSGTNATGLVFKPQLEKGTTPTSFAPYVTPKTNTVSLGRTVYRGQLNVLTGELTITHEVLDASTLTWVAQTNSRWFYNGVQSTIKIPPNNSTPTETISEQYVAMSNNDMASTTNIGLSVNASGSVVVRNGSTIDTPTGLIVYPLATPQTVQLTPEKVRTLLGVNNISADTGDVDLVYVRDLNIVINDLINRVTALENE